MKKPKIYKDRITGRWVLSNKRFICEHPSFESAMDCLDNDIRRRR